MRSLRDVIFKWFLGGVILLFATFVGITVWTGEDLFVLIWGEVAGPFVHYVAESMVDAYEEGGVLKLNAMRLRTTNPAGVTSYLYDSSGRELQGQIAPEKLKFFLKDLAIDADDKSERIPFEVTREGTFAGTTVHGRTGRSYTAALIIPYTPFLDWQLPIAAMFLRVGFGLCIAAIACYWLAHHLTRPLIRLREAAQKFASGNMGARAGKDTGQNQVREIHELANDFDEMAARIESLMDGQRRLLLDISHELRTPLTRMTLAMGIARRSASPETYPALDRMEREADKLNQLISRVIAINRLEATGEPVSRQAVDLSQLVTQIVDDARLEAQVLEKSVEFSERAPCILEADPELLGSAIENIVRNAIRHTKAGTAVEVRLESSAEAVYIIVIDHGSGVPDEVIGKLFDPFFRVQQGRESQSGGIGLGLTIAYRAVKLHGGTIEPRNHKAGGLEMLIQLPLFHSYFPVQN